jgi:hypothetical protein
MKTSVICLICETAVKKQQEKYKYKSVSGLKCKIIDGWKCYYSGVRSG